VVSLLLATNKEDRKQIKCMSRLNTTAAFTVALLLASCPFIVRFISTSRSLASALKTAAQNTMPPILSLQCGVLQHHRIVFFFLNLLLFTYFHFAERGALVQAAESTHP